MLFNYKSHRIFAFSDTHGMHRRLHVPEAADILLCAGDVVSGFGKDDMDDFFSWLLSHPAKLYIFVAGNHELFLEDSPELAMSFLPKKVIFLHDSTIEFDGITLLKFIYHHLVNHSRISFVLQDFREFSDPYPLIRATSTELGKETPFDSNVQAVSYGLCFKHDDDLATSYVDALGERINKIDDDIQVHWSIQFSADNVAETLFFYKPNFN